MQDESATSTLAQYGGDFGEMGIYVENTNIKVDWSQYVEHTTARDDARNAWQYCRKRQSAFTK